MRERATTDTIEGTIRKVIEELGDKPIRVHPVTATSKVVRAMCERGELTVVEDREGGWWLRRACRHVEDNQGLCHKCGILMNADRAEV